MNGDVLIIGAGVTGLLLAQGLRSKGIGYRIFERDNGSRSSRDWGMSMHWGAEFLSSVLPADLVDRLHEIDTDPYHDASKDAGYVQCNGETGEILVVMKSSTPKRVSRARFRGLLNDGLNIEYEKELLAVTMDHEHSIVTAEFREGTVAQGRLLIGCDGSRSRVREIMVGDPNLSRPRASDYTIMNFTATFPAPVSTTLRDIHPVFKVGYHPKMNAMFLLSILDSWSTDPVDWVHGLLLSWTGAPYPEDLKEPQSRSMRLRELGTSFASPWSVAASNVSEASALNVDRGTFWDPRPVFTTNSNQDSDGSRHQSHVCSLWNGNNQHGLVTLAGDAAHPMLPHRGQGLNHSLEDVSRLLDVLVKISNQPSDGLTSAIGLYEQEMVARGGAEVELTLKQARAAHDWELLMRSPMFSHGAHKVDPS